MRLNTNIRGAKIQILNIKPKYHPKIKLKKGIYKIKISKRGYRSRYLSIDPSKTPKKYVKLYRYKSKEKDKPTIGEFVGGVFKDLGNAISK